MRIEQQQSISKVCAQFKSVEAMYATHLVPKTEYEAMEAKIKAGRLAVAIRKARDVQ